jgi:multidrug efflux system membrane fusion protein
MTRSRMLMVAAMAAVVGAGYWYYSTRNATSGGTAKVPPPVPVTVAQANLGDVPVLLDVVGRAEAYESVTLKSRLDGQVAAVPYTEGQHVRQGEVLVQLDAGDFDARLLQAEANLARNEANWPRPGPMSALSRPAGTRLRVRRKGQRAAYRRSGRRGHGQGRPGGGRAGQAPDSPTPPSALPLPASSARAWSFPARRVKINETALAVVNRVRPLYVTFSVPEKHLPRLRKAMRAVASCAPASRFPATGSSVLQAAVRFLDNTVDASTGTIQMKALLENREEQLTPGQFLNVSLSLDTLPMRSSFPPKPSSRGRRATSCLSSGRTTPSSPGRSRCRPATVAWQRLARASQRTKRSSPTASSG